MNKDVENIENVYYELLMITEKLLKDKHDSLAIAGVLINQGLSLYKAALTDAGYDRIIQSIADKKNIVEPYEMRELH